MKYFIQTILLFFIVSCSTTKSVSIDQITGTYRWIGIYGVGETIQIKSDSTFVFTWRQGLIGGKTLGTIKYQNNALRLYSELKKDSIPYKLEISSQTEQDFYELKVIDSNGIPIEFSNCSAKKDGKFIGGNITNELGVCVLKYDEIDSIEVQFIGFYTAKIPIQKNSPKSMIVTLQEEFFYCYFDDQAIKRKNSNVLKINTFDTDKKFKKVH